MSARLAPTDHVAYGDARDPLCGSCADRECVDGIVTRGDLAGEGIGVLECVACCTIILPERADERDATADVIDALRAVFPAATVGEADTGGNCRAVAATFPDGRYIYVTNADASLPDGFDLFAGLYDAEGECVRDLLPFSPATGHDIEALTAVLGTVAKG